MIKKRLAAIAGVAALAAALASAGTADAATTASARPLAISSYCYFSSLQNTLSEGSGGSDVEQAQCELNWAFALGSTTNYGNGPHGGLIVDGSFGANTLAATKAFQKCAGISQDGIIGPNTWAQLNKWVNASSYC